MYLWNTDLPNPQKVFKEDKYWGLLMVTPWHFSLVCSLAGLAMPTGCTWLGGVIGRVLVGGWQEVAYRNWAQRAYSGCTIKRGKK